jgi:hypothetical protein
MPRPPASARHFRARFVAVAAVFGGHVALFVLLAKSGDRDVPAPENERMEVVFFDLPSEPAEVTSRERARLATGRQPGHAATSPAVDTPEAGSHAITQPGIDWDVSARRAAARQAAAPAPRDFGFPRREPPPREKKEFGWDKVHTERVRPLKGGGIGIRLSDNCEIALLPLPIGGCSLGKRKARGDLFDEMDAPPVLGDWK